MSKLKQLAGQTIWYGGSSIAARFLNYLLTPFLTVVFTRANYGLMSLVYTAIPIFNVLFTYGMETAFFRFSNNKDYTQKDVYDTTGTSLFLSTFLFGGILLLFYKTIAVWAGIGDYPELILMSILIIMLDTLSTIPFAKLRLAGRPKKYALIKVLGISINIIATLFFLWLCPLLLKKDPQSFVRHLYDPSVNGVFYVVLANLIQALITYVLLFKEVLQLKFKIDKVLWKQIMLYTMPLIIAGLGGVINETFDRRMLEALVPGDPEYKRAQVGIYSACYKISILITLFIQAFRMGAEPFFFKESSGKHPQKVYARVMKFFIIVICTMFLFVALYLDVWKYFIDEKFWAGLNVVPILLLANMFLGIYLNLSIWYKLGDKTTAGAYLTMAGVAITLLINYLFIPSYGYIACAWATLACYGGMMIMSYFWGRKKYPIPYEWKKLVIYLVAVVGIYLVHHFITGYVDSTTIKMFISSSFVFIFVALVILSEREELRGLPYFGKYFLPKK